MSSKLTLECLNKLINDLSYEDEQMFIKSIIEKEKDKLYCFPNRLSRKNIIIHAKNYEEALKKVEAGDVEHVSTFVGKDGGTYIRSIPDHDKTNNLDALPSF